MERNDDEGLPLPRTRKAPWSREEEDWHISSWDVTVGWDDLRDAVRAAVEQLGLDDTYSATISVRVGDLWVGVVPLEPVSAAVYDAGLAYASLRDRPSARREAMIQRGEEDYLEGAIEEISIIWGVPRSR